MRIVNSTEKGFKIYNKAPDKAQIIIYGEIGKDYWGDGMMISAKAFSEELGKIPDTVKEIEVRINSGGGDVFEGITIYNRLKQHKAKKKVYVDGLAASISSIIALAGDEVIMGEGALYMIHLPWTWAVGDRQALDNTINRLMDIEEQMLGIYAKKTKMDRNEIRAMLEKETWLDADQAIEQGFANEKMEDTVPIAASAMKMPWITKAPKNYISEKEAANKKIASMQAAISAKLKPAQKK